MSTETNTLNDGLLNGISAWARDVGLGRKLAVGLGIAAIVSGFATYVVLTGSSPFGPDPQAVFGLLLVDLVLGLLLGSVVSFRLVRLWLERRRGAAGSRLHTRLVFMFSFMAVAPAIVVAVFSYLFFDLGVQAWFSDRVRTALSDSLVVAKAYTNEHRQLIRADALAMAADLNREASVLIRHPARFKQILIAQAALRNLSEAIVFERSGRVLARSELAFSMAFELAPDAALEQAESGEVAIVNDDIYDRVRALVRLDHVPNAFLFVGRFVDPKVLGHVARAELAVSEYRRLEGERSGIRINFVLIFAVVALLMLLAAVWFALSFAARLMGPISSLVGAAEQARGGDLSVRVPEGPPDDEIGTLSRAFNRMTTQLLAQRTELVDANQQLDTRRRFTEAVLSGVSAGVIGLDANGRINLPNRSATHLLDTDAEMLAGESLVNAIPEMAGLLMAARSRPSRFAEGDITVARSGRRRTLHCRISAEAQDDNLEGFVVTFDDITELVSAQRTSAWADIARRIAHEIKNPLTPIQLSAERLKRKYQDEISSDPQVFAQCTDTIIRQVGDIGRMIDEFSSFARMPSPNFSVENIRDLVQQALFMQQVAHSSIEFVSKLPEGSVELMCDRHQTAQVLTNLLQNAADAINEARLGEAILPKGRIEVVVADNGSTVSVEISDNGPGLPVEQRDRLFEPYVTTRTKGTGLGLAIVKKVMEDHSGELFLENSPNGGACARLVFHREARESPDERAA
jgi:two-component system nitrogen regulation sensor histidine kinase NtrY